MPRSSKKSSLVETKVRTWLKRHDPAYVEKMKALSKDEKNKQKRNIAGKVRRAGHAATHAVFKKKSPLRDNEGNVYSWNDSYKRLLMNDKYVVRRARNGSIHLMAYENEEDLDDNKYEDPILSDNDVKVYEHVEKLLNGDEDLDKKMRTRKFVVERELTDDDCYWRNLSSEEKRELIKKLKKKNTKKGSK